MSKQVDSLISKMERDVEFDGSLGTIGQLSSCVEAESPAKGFGPPAGCLNVDLGGVETDLLFAT